MFEGESSLGASIIEEPERGQWSSVLRENLQKPPRFHGLREAMLASASDYTSGLVELARREEVQLKKTATVKNRPIVMAGHQPIIYHFGLLRKNLSLQQIADDSQASAVNLVIDLDDASAGFFKYPGRFGDSPQLHLAVLSEGSTFTGRQTIIPKSAQLVLWDQVTDGLKLSGVKIDWEIFDKVRSLYISYAGHNAAAVNSIVRSLFEPKRNYLEILLSDLVRLPASQSILSSWCNQGEKLSREYNSTLESHRNLNKIKSNVNPFPNLTNNSGKAELPLWIVDFKASRRLTIWSSGSSLFLSSDGKVFEPFSLDDLNADLFLSPRGALLSLFYRAYCSDLFIHGLGGRTYDTFTDRLAINFLGDAPPRFVAVSENRYLFPQQIREAARWEEMESRKKDIISHSDDYLNSLPFSAEENSYLKSLGTQRTELVQRLNQTPASPQKASVGQTLKQVNEQVRNIVEGALRRLKPYDSDDIREIWFTRDYPVFFQGIA